MKKRKRRPAHEPVTKHRTSYRPEGCPFDFADAVWHDDRGRYWPAMTHCRRDSGEEGDCAIKSEPYEEALDAARTAEYDLKRLIDEPELPRTSSEVKSLMSKFGYSMRPMVEPEDVLPVEAVLYEYGVDEVETLSPADQTMHMIFNDLGSREINPVSNEKRKRWPARPFMVADIWRDLGRNWPVLTFGPGDPAEDPFCAIKSESRRRPTNAALIALLDIKKAQAELEPGWTGAELRRFISTIGYTERPGLHPSDVMPAEDVRESDQPMMNILALAMYRQVEEYIRVGDPPIMKETADRLIGIGLSGDEAIGLICKALALDYTQSPDHAITPTSIDRIVGILSRLPDLPDF